MRLARISLLSPFPSCKSPGTSSCQSDRSSCQCRRPGGWAPTARSAWWWHWSSLPWHKSLSWEFFMQDSNMTATRVSLIRCRVCQKGQFYLNSFFWIVHFYFFFNYYWKHLLPHFLFLCKVRFLHFPNLRCRILDSFLMTLQKYDKRTLG